MSIQIFSHPLMRAQLINWYLLMMALSDSIILVGAFFVLTLPRLGETLSFWKATAISYYSAPYMYALMTLAQTISVWMTTVMSIHRFIGVCVPMNSLYRKIFYEWAYTLIMFAVPFTILIMVNSLVIGAVHRSRRIHAEFNIYDDELRKQEFAKEISTSIMLVAIVVAFLLCNTPAFAVNLFEKLDLLELYSTTVPWSNMLVMTNASINICIFCIFSEKYRQLLGKCLKYNRCFKLENDKESISIAC
ncbi:unnamed protein product [Dracunculus medinensis]|uniref:G_PROTEIN_RECEP_F1_2 domain-containing protein n=1 Tax=Dracunculus medinensis TaxID=318479 RepID=A0A0N4U3G5_DRAME|nr:unnamed protein product [Dracunculus medinensis]